MQATCGTISPDLAAGVPGLLVTLQAWLRCRADGSFMLLHSTLRAWLATSGHKFSCDSRLGHAAIALRLAAAPPQQPEAALDLAHHILKVNFQHK